MEDTLTPEQMSEKTKWFDTLYDLGFVLEGYVKNTPNRASLWDHKEISGLVVRLGLITAESHPRCGHFDAIIHIEWTWPEPSLHIHAESPDKLREIYSTL